MTPLLGGKDYIAHSAENNRLYSLDFSSLEIQFQQSRQISNKQLPAMSTAATIKGL